MKTVFQAAPLALALALSLGACSKSDTAANTTTANEAIPADEGAAAPVDETNVSAGESVADNAAIDAGSLDNGAGANGAAVANGF